MQAWQTYHCDHGLPPKIYCRSLNTCGPLLIISCDRRNRQFGEFNIRTSPKISNSTRDLQQVKTLACDSSVHSILLSRDFIAKIYETFTSDIWKRTRFTTNADVRQRLHNLNIQRWIKSTQSYIRNEMNSSSYVEYLLWPISKRYYFVFCTF